MLYKILRPDIICSLVADEIVTLFLFNLLSFKLL
jgi:hypothetical protein